jgi:hypothetical protein
MKKYFVLYDLKSGDSFESADLHGVYFGKEFIRRFDSEEDAINRLNTEFELFPSQFFDRIIVVIPCYSVE